VSEIDISNHGDTLALATHEDEISQLYLLATAILQSQQVPGIPGGLISRLKFHPDGQTQQAQAAPGMGPVGAVPRGRPWWLGNIL